MLHLTGSFGSKNLGLIVTRESCHWADDLKNIKCRLPEPNKLSTFCIPHDQSWVVQQQKTLVNAYVLFHR